MKYALIIMCLVSACSHVEQEPKQSARFKNNNEIMLFLIKENGSCMNPPNNKKQYEREKESHARRDDTH